MALTVEPLWANFGLYLIGMAIALQYIKLDISHKKIVADGFVHTGVFHSMSVKLLMGLSKHPYLLGLCTFGPLKLNPLDGYATKLANQESICS